MTAGVISSKRTSVQMSQMAFRMRRPGPIEDGTALWTCMKRINACENRQRASQKKARESGAPSRLSGGLFGPGVETGLAHLHIYGTKIKDVFSFMGFIVTYLNVPKCPMCAPVSVHPPCLVWADAYSIWYHIIHRAWQGSESRRRGLPANHRPSLSS